MFHRLGISLIRPQAFPSKDKDLEERALFKKTAEIIADDSRTLVFHFSALLSTRINAVSY